MKGKRVIARLDLNVPVQDGKIVDDLRIRVSIPTIQYLKDAGAKIILTSHIETKDNPTLAPIADELQKTFALKFVKDFLGEEGKSAVAALGEGDIVLFENLRTNEGEKKNDMEFAKALAAYADIYVNDAFAVSHREHASIVALPSLLPHFAGFQLMEEIDHLKTVFNPPRPFLFILGGAKFDTKIPLIQKFLNLSDSVFVGGALVNNIYKEMGYQIGTSLVSEGDFKIKEVLSDKRLFIPTDVVVKTAGGSVVKKADAVNADESIVDVGPQSVADFGEKVRSAKFVLWNGPLGNYENGFKDQTLAMAQVISESGVHAAVGGGDTVAALASITESPELKNNNIFISSGGGAMLQYLLDETLVGIEALK